MEESKPGNGSFPGDSEDGMDSKANGTTAHPVASFGEEDGGGAKVNYRGWRAMPFIIGLQVIQLTAGIKHLHPPACGNSSTCVGPTVRQMAFLLAGLGLLITGEAGVRPCNFAFGADQFNPHTKSGKSGIDSFFNWYFFTFTFAEMVSVTLIVYVQSNVSWAIGLEIPAILMMTSVAVYFMGLRIYAKVKAQGSPVTSIAQVVVVAVKKSRLELPDQPQDSLFKYIPPQSFNSKLPYTDQFTYLDKAAIVTPNDKINPDGSPADPWRLCSVQQVEETFAIFQETQSDRRLGSSGFKIPAATYTVFLMPSLSIFIPIYDGLLVPLLRRVTGKPGGITVLQRMVIGFLISVLALLVSAIVEERRRTIALTRPTLGVYLEEEQSRQCQHSG
ncbi:hypothetical protein MLD38_026162 [Melastoma candidum]|uniref:Uncharacterized protein n=1 Tax=Melastoma candidum TaxID=119954 RepID=A0ACB9NYQ1_9MYRT|nr:hypothetical protein MLD38_026162 [Melastoma candidum]